MRPKEAALDTENHPDGTLGCWSVAYRDEDGKLCVEPHNGREKGIDFGSTFMIGHNWKWDLRVLRANKMPEPTNIADTMIAAYCVHPSVRVLTRDLHWIKSGQVKVGDELIGVDEHTVGKKRRVMRPARVTDVSRRKAPCYKVTFSNGKELIASDDHPWLTNMNRHKAAWRATKELRLGWRMLCPLSTWETDCSYEAGYLAGILDGEGSWTKWNMQITQKPGHVLSYVERLLKSRHIPYCRNERRDGCVRLGISCTTNALPFLGSVRAGRLIAKERWNGVSPTRRTDPEVFVSSLEFLGEQEVVTLETDIHTFNAEGFWVHNCLGHGRQQGKDGGDKSGDKMVGGLGLKYLARRLLGFEMKSWLDIKDKPEEIQEYNAKDSIATLLLWEKFKPLLPKHFWEIDMPLLPVLMAMEDRGVQVDPNFLQEYAEKLDVELDNTKEGLQGINPYSPPQIIDYVYNKLGVEPTKFTETGQPSTDAEVLELIDDPVVKKILEYREFYKERKTYVSAYTKALDPQNRIHCDFKQTSTATGRLSSARPNLQNVTIGTDLRKLFIAPEGKSIVRVDWQRLELWTFAAILGKGRMLETLQAGGDPHQDTADFLGIDRAEGRNVNFLMLYGGGAWKISMEFGVPIDKAKAMIAKYYEAYPEILAYHNQQIQIAHSEKEVKNWFGRTRRLDAMYSEHWKTIKEGEREAINTPIQGTGAEIVKRAMIELHYPHDAPMTCQVHDELLFEIDDKDALEYGHWLKSYLPTITEINGVYFPVDVSIGKNWAEAKEESNKI